MFNRSVNRLWLYLFVLAGSVSLVVGFVGSQLLRSGAAEIEALAIQSRIERQMRLAAPALQRALRGAESADVQRALKLVVVEPAVIVASVFDAENKLLARAGDSDHEIAPQVASIGMRIADEAGAQLGRLDVSFRSAPGLAVRLRNSGDALLVLLIALLAGGGVLLYGLRRRVGRPLAMVAERLRRDDLESVESGRAGGDEIDSFLDEYNQHARRLAESSAALERDCHSLRLGKSNLEQLLDHLPGIVYRATIAPDRRLLYINAGSKSLTGHSAEALLAAGADSLSMLIVEADRGRVWAEVESAVRHHEPYRIEYRLQMRDGATRWVLEQGREIQTEVGRPVLQGVIIDIAARKAVEEHLQQSAAVFESSSEAIMVTLPDGQLAAVNQAFTQITGYPAEEVLGKTPAFNKSGWHDAAFYRNLWAEIGSFGRWQGEIWNRRKNGEIYPAWLTISAVKSDTGKIINYVANFTDIANLKRTSVRIEDYYFRDALTGLPNQQLLAGRLDLAIQRARRARNTLAVLVLDLDYFDDINHRAGLDVGDRLLQAIAQRLPGQLRGQDSIARLGSDEFAVVIEDLHGAYAAAVVAEKLLALFKQPFRHAGGDYLLNASLGISVYPEDGQQVGTLLQAADTAMYRAKELGRGVYQFASQAREQEAARGQRLNNDLPKALHRGELRLYYQPVLNLDSGAIESIEALLRWPHPEFGLLGAEQILAVAEAEGRMLALGEWVLASVCHQLAHWRDTAVPLPRVSVNLAPAQWRDLDLAQSLADVLAESATDPAQLALEIPEAALTASHFPRGKLREAAALGVELVLDRFGVAPLDLGIMAEVPFRTVKLDRQLLSSWPPDELAERRLDLCLATARALNLRTVAVGIESAAQQQWLQHRECELGQGRLLGAPIPAQQLQELLLPVPPSGTG